jgi:hypothetical protein
MYSVVGDAGTFSTHVPENAADYTLIATRRYLSKWQDIVEKFCAQEPFAAEGCTVKLSGRLWK